MTLGPQLLLSGMKPSCVVSDTQPQVYTQVINQVVCNYSLVELDLFPEFQPQTTTEGVVWCVVA